jgi:hypothetical protein
VSSPSFNDPRRRAREARRDVEAALDAAGWPWARALSLWLDALLVLEELAAEPAP